MPHSHDGRCCDRCLRRWEFTSRLLDESDDADASSTGSTSSEDSTLRQSDDDFVELSPVEWNSADEYHHSIYSSSSGSSEHWAEADASPSSSSASSSSSLTDERGDGAVPDSDLPTHAARLRHGAVGQDGNSITSSGSTTTGLRATLPLRQQETSAGAIRPGSGSGSGSRPGPEDDLVRQSNGNSATSDAATQQPSELWTRRFNRRLERRPTFLAGNTFPEDDALSEARPPVASLASMLRSLDVHGTPSAPGGNKRRKTRNARSDAEVPLLSLEELSDSSGRSGRAPSQQPPSDTWRAPQQSPVLRRQSRVESMRQGSERWHDETMPALQELGRRVGSFQPRQSRITYWPSARSGQDRNHTGIHNETS